jgi:hypothetical protein
LISIYRAAIESYFSIELNDPEFEELLRDVPCTTNNQVEYLEFMTKFDTDNSSTLFDAVSVRNDDFRPRQVKKYDTIQEENEDNDDYNDHEKPKKNSGRNASQVKNYFFNKFILVFPISFSSNDFS